MNAWGKLTGRAHALYFHASSCSDLLADVVAEDKDSRRLILDEEKSPGRICVGHHALNANRVLLLCVLIRKLSHRRHRGECRQRVGGCRISRSVGLFLLGLHGRIAQVCFPRRCGQKADDVDGGAHLD